jgi:xanthine dehydrogenase accessory factor
MLLYVLESKGSSPGRQGFFMAVTADGEMEGSIGGGIMEHKFVELAKEQIRQRGESNNLKESVVKKQIHDKTAGVNQSGMICSGEQTILLYFVATNDKQVIEKLIQSLEKLENGTLILSPKGIDFVNEVSDSDFHYEYEADSKWMYKEKTGYKNKLFIIGGGHCALALSRLMRSMDFYICVYDDREDLKTVAENEAAHEKHSIESYDKLNKLIHSGSNHYVVIMTFGYRTDDIAIKALIEKQFKYMGVLGSKKKMEKLINDYRQQGIATELLKKLYTPIGIAINSQTPEEIAISIAAEIIQVKNTH